MAIALRLPGPSDEAACRWLDAQLVDDGYGFLPEGGTWQEVLDGFARAREGIDLAPGRVPATLVVAEVDGALVGCASVRHALNEHLLHEGGHVGYAVAPQHRRRGYATALLLASVDLLAARGVDRILVTCDDVNVASATVIERCGGVLEDVRAAGDGTPKRRYWIDATASRTTPRR